jgi:hypothetical protein
MYFLNDSLYGINRPEHIQVENLAEIIDAYFRHRRSCSSLAGTL